MQISVCKHNTAYIVFQFILHLDVVYVKKKRAIYLKTSLFLYIVMVLLNKKSRILGAMILIYGDCNEF